MITELGKFKIVTVADGDTIKVDRAPMPEISHRNTLRLLHLDTEEISNPKLFGPVTDYARQVQEMACAWFAERGNQVELQSEGAPLCGYFDRPLVQVFAGGEHYQQHAIAAGWSPYFCKYGYSQEYHQQLQQAQSLAQSEQKGIWSPQLQARPDKENRPYALLLDWWKIRAEQIQSAFEQQRQCPDLLLLVNGRDYAQVLTRAQQQQSAIVFGEISRPPGGSQAGSGLFLIQVKMNLPFYLYVSKKIHNRAELIAAIEAQFISNTRTLPDSLVKNNFAFVSGRLTLYHYHGQQIPEIIITDPSQVRQDFDISQVIA